MIDTIVLTLSSDMFTISEPDKFVPSARWATNLIRAPHGITSKQNPTIKELRAGIYKPRLTLSRWVSKQSKPEIRLKIELSLPKLMFGENFSELKTRDFTKVAQKLAVTLEGMGVVVKAQTLAKAPASAIHYAKNIPLTDGTTPYHFINKIKDANIKLSLDVNQTDYRNDGHSFRWHCNSYEVIFYDKIKDLEAAKKSSKRALEKDSALQLHLFDELRKNQKFEVLRMEVRLNKRTKIKQLFNTLGIKSALTFKNLFKSAIAKKVLLHYLDELESKRPAFLDYRAANDKALLAALVFNNPEMSAKQILNAFGLKKALETVSMRELRTIFTKLNQRSWQRLMNDINKVQLPIKQNIFGVIRTSIIKFKSTDLRMVCRSAQTRKKQKIVCDGCR